MFLKTEERPAGEIKELSEDAKLLLKAAAIIERDGHCKHLLHTGSDEFGPVCLLGAVHRAFCGSSWGPSFDSQEGRRLRHLVNLAGGVGWNNASPTTPKEVIERLRQTAYEIG